jgi:alpha-2-macroglobulin
MRTLISVTQAIFNISKQLYSSNRQVFSDSNSSKSPVRGNRSWMLPAVMILIAFFVGWGTFFSDAADVPNPDALRAAAAKALRDGNFKTAFEGYRKLALAENNSKLKVADDLRQAVHSLNRLGRLGDFDDLVEGSIKVHSTNWRLLQQAAMLYRSVNQNGQIVAGEFQRSGRQGKGKPAHSMFRDRARALQLYEAARKLSQDEPDQNQVGQLLGNYAQALLQRMGYTEAWRLQALTDLTELPDVEEHQGWWWYQPRNSGAPVEQNGTPVYHKLPKTFETAQSDGERWRWLLAEVAERNPHRALEMKNRFADFWRQQLGVQTMAQFGGWPRGGMIGRDDADDKNESGTYAVQTLDDNETIARTAVGIKRIQLPDEFNFVRIYKEIAESGKTSQGTHARTQLCQIYENRRQYPEAAESWRTTISEYGKGYNGSRQKRLDQIVNNWGRFEPGRTQSEGKGATVDYRFRNGKTVEFEAFPIKIELLLDDLKKYLKSNPERVDYQSINIGNIGHRLVNNNQAKYIDKKIATWKVNLKPQPSHVDDRITVTTPLSEGGAYLVVATMKNGNESRIILWVDDTVIVKKPINQKTMYYIADAESGQAIPKANIEFFGWRQDRVDNTKRYTTFTKNFAEFTNEDGIVTLDRKDDRNRYQWLLIARKKGRFAYFGFDRIWFGQRYDSEYSATKVFTITDRPVYRPDQTVKYKFWIRQAKYDQADTSAFANQSFTVTISNPKGENVASKKVKSDEYGGIEGEFKLKSDAQLGVYSASVLNHGGGTFRVEEYKKPEFEVTIDSPSIPVKLGEKVTTTINAKYYFGAPVTKAKVKYKVLRTQYDGRWYPTTRWDWFYGSGYWWHGYNYNWYPGWAKWGCESPIHWWLGAAHRPPEVVLENEAEIGDDGQLKFDIDTQLAKEMHGDQDHRYQIVAEVVDESRRTIVGTGSVLVSRQPFKVFSWVNRGHYRTGDDVVASFQAHTLDQKPVAGKGQVSLFAIKYNKDQEPVEKAVETWKLDPNAEGRARQQFKAGAPGQYRISYSLADEKNNTIEGGYVFVVTGKGFDGNEFRFNDLELITDKRDYKAGEKVKLLVNTNRADATVLLFVRPSNGVYLPPKVVKLNGKSFVEEIDVGLKDMPNFFVEAVTVANAKVHTEMKEIVVPPAKRVLNIDIKPDHEKYKPGQEAKVQLRLTDHTGEPFVGSTVLSVYDKSVEYISGGSNVPEIREFFWKWRRHHHPNSRSSSNHYSVNIVKSGHLGMSNLGVFGQDIVEEFTKNLQTRQAGGEFGNRDGRKGNAYAEGNDMAEAKADSAKDFDDAGPDLVQPTVRSNFADTAHWVGSVKTDEEGFAEVSFNMPENLTGWKIKAWGIGHGTRVGEGSTEVVTFKNLLLRLQAPRFFVQKDEVVLSANVHNYLDEDKLVQVALETEGGCLQSMDESLTQTVMIKANGEKRIDWRVKVIKEGEAVVRMKALTDEESDAMQMTFPCFVHGMLKTDSFSGVVRVDDESQSIKLKVPAERRPDQTRLELRYSPTLAGSMVDALPYLTSFPYGCTEQTLNRFLPTVITQNVLRRMNLDLKAIQEKRTNLNAQEIGDDKERAKRWKNWEHNPVFDEAKVAAMVKSGVERLTSMQLSDGGWGWFSGHGEHSYPHTTAVVVHGLQTAAKNDVAIVPGVLQKGLNWLKRYQDEQVLRLKNFKVQKNPCKLHASNIDALVFMTLVDSDVVNQDMLDFLYRDRKHLSVYGKTVYGLALHQVGEKKKLAMIIENIEQFLVQDEENQTAYLRLPADTYWWYWWGSDIESNAWYLKLLAATNPKSKQAAGVVKYLLNNRRHGSYWRSTRDTAYCIEAMADYLKASGEAEPDMTIEIFVDGERRKSVKVDKNNLFSFDNKLVIEGVNLDSGNHTVEVRRKGTGPVYFNAYLTNFTLEDFITKAGLEIKVNRKYYKLTKVDKKIDAAGSRGQLVAKKVEKYKRTEIKNLDTINSGDLVEVELLIESKNDYEYILFEDMKAAGFEPVDVRSGYSGNEMGAYVEYRDEKVALFVNWLPRGRHSMSYRIRAEIPGKFSALPTKASAMYAPELRANSDELKVSIVD